MNFYCRCQEQANPLSVRIAHGYFRHLLVRQALPHNEVA